ncbi:MULTISPECIES: ABC transporter permease [unclassified Streptomyces]|uniref:ABC transporter permease n=1 Tax=unclassified Streptomyces TaxID=2593676 RepID=UPI000883F23E|nr:MULTISPECIES: FtsX-like permease family protein [unclassified Streptomyces]PBC85648.1 putative ABC transport system permease protein [Streptomyces sp. 2321.6]SDR09663.1 putative ABC transport system permease protein [Streptomyces sp. KS_16]SED74808.1 putative ABC transport system permease protein [Streptomyces sp. 2133.1]SNC72390.1 putative ABC transport system permease protein [Streptomyces sp. 2114.4]
MFVAWRDLRFAKGRFALMGTVIVLITVLVGLLSGLTAGLGRENTSAITALPADHLVFSAPADGRDVAFTDSRLTERTVRAWARVPGVRHADPLGIAPTKAESGGRTAAVSLFGVRPGSQTAPARVEDGAVVLSAKAAASLGVRAGGTLTLGGRTVRVAAVSGAAMYAHTPVVWTPLQDWRRLASGAGAAAGDQPGRTDASGDPVGATVLALSTSGTAGLAAADRALGTRTVAAADALQAIGSYAAENGSLQLMRGFLFAISALVIGAFFTVWTIQRGGEVAVLKALGASTRSLLRDALGQAVVLLVGGTALGSAVVAAVGAGIGGTVPFVLAPATVAAPALIMIALGAAGAALAIRRITSVDPLTALGSAR